METERVEFDHDLALANRPQPDRNLLARAHNLMLKEEHPNEKWTRQQWEVAIGATKVALDAWRKVWPYEIEVAFAKDEQKLVVRAIESALAQAFTGLDSLSETILGQVAHLATLGLLTDEMMIEFEKEGEDDRPDEG